MVNITTTLISSIVISLIIGGLLGFYISQASIEPKQVTPTVAEPPVSEKNVVQITDKGFVSNTIKIKAGEVVTFISKATAPVWPAGDNHPTHDAYPSDVYNLPGDQAKSFGSKACVEYGIRKGDVFDPCRLLLPEETFSFRFNEKGTWSFHNHVRPEHTGKIIVE